MTTEDFLLAIRRRAESRFTVQTDAPENEELLALAAEELIDRRVIRLRRNGSADAGCRTILIVALDSGKNLTMTTRWAADVRDSLLEPETSDLYMILLVADITDNDGASIEANEQFCRKFVCRSGEDIEKMLDRTFLGPVIAQTDGEVLIDPFVAALSQTSERHLWLDSHRREYWHAALLSGKTGSDLFESLLADAPIEGGKQ